MPPFEPRVETAPRRSGIEHHVLRRDADCLGRRAARQFTRLRGDPQFQLAAVEARRRAGGLDRGVDCRGDGIILRIIGPCESAVRIPFGHDALALALRQRGIERAQCTRALDGRGPGEDRPHRRKRAVGNPPAFGHCREIAFGLHHPHQPLEAGHRFLVEGGQFGLPQRPVPDRGVDHARQADIAGEQEAAVDLGGQVEPREGGRQFGLRRGRILAGRFDPQRRRIGRVERSSLRGQFAEAQFLFAVAHETRCDFAFFPAHAPAFCRRHGEQRAGRRGGRAQRLFIGCERKAFGRGAEGVAPRKAFGQQAIGIIGQAGQTRPQRRPFRGERSVGEQACRRCGFDGDLPPVGTQFDCHDLRQHGGHALPHLELRQSHGDHAVFGNGEPAAEAVFVRSGDQRAGIAARPQPPADRQPAADCGPGQQLPPRNRQRG